MLGHRLSVRAFLEEFGCSAHTDQVDHVYRPVLTAVL